MIDLIPTFNGQMAFRVWTNEKRVYSLDTFHGAWTSLVFSHCLAYNCHGCSSTIAKPDGFESIYDNWEEPRRLAATDDRESRNDHAPPWIAAEWTGSWKMFLGRQFMLKLLDLQREWGVLPVKREEPLKSLYKRLIWRGQARARTLTWTIFAGFFGNFVNVLRLHCDHNTCVYFWWTIVVSCWQPLLFVMFFQHLQ